MQMQETGGGLRTAVALARLLVPFKAWPHQTRSAARLAVGPCAAIFLAISIAVRGAAEVGESLGYTMKNTMESQEGAQVPNLDESWVDEEETRSEKEVIEAVIEAVRQTQVLWYKWHHEYKINDARNAGWIAAARLARVSGM